MNNAGVYGPMGSIDDDRLGRVGAGDRDQPHRPGLLLPRKAVEAFKPHRYGKIVNLSGGGATNPAARHQRLRGVEGGGRALHRDAGPGGEGIGIDVNAVAPGALTTRLTDQLVAAGPERVGAGLHERMIKLQKEGGTPLECRRLALRLSGLRRERRPHRPPDRGAMGPVAASPTRSRAGSTRPTSTRCAASSRPIAASLGQE